MATTLAIALRKAAAAERLANAAAGLDLAPPEITRKAGPDQQAAELMEWAAATLEEIAARAPVEAPTMVSTAEAAPKRSRKSSKASDDEAAA